jgi:hypothetical protein
MIWEYDHTLQSYRLTEGRCSARVWQLTSGHWAGRVTIERRHQIETFDTHELARRWCEQVIDDFRRGGRCEDRAA